MKKMRSVWVASLIGGVALACGGQPLPDESRARGPGPAPELEWAEPDLELEAPAPDDVVTPNEPELRAPEKEPTPRPEPTLEPPKPPENREIFSGSAHWLRVESDCPSSRLTPAESSMPVTVTVIGSDISIDLPTMPQLTGRLFEGRAEISGFTTFPGQLETISCTVNGQVEMTDSLLTAETTEELSSESELNCASSFELTLELQ